jgi:hypothetical protein
MRYDDDSCLRNQICIAAFVQGAKFSELTQLRSFLHYFDKEDPKD